MLASEAKLFGRDQYFILNLQILCRFSFDGMHYTWKTALRLEKLLKEIQPQLRKRGRSSALANFCGCHRQSIYKWFIRGEGRPTAAQVLLACRWSEETSRRKTLRYFPSWIELRERTRIITQADRLLQWPDEFSGFRRSDVVRYILHPDRNSWMPDGEFALALIEWFEIARKKYDRDEKQTHPDIRQVFDEEKFSLGQRAKEVGRPHRFIGTPDTV